MKCVNVLVVLAVASCSSWHGSGTVVQKTYSPAWVETTTSQQCYPAGKSTFCVPTTNTVTHPQGWSLKVREDTGDTHWVDVDQGEYDVVGIGDDFTNGEPD